MLPAAVEVETTGDQSEICQNIGSQQLQCSVPCYDNNIQGRLTTAHMSATHGCHQTFVSLIDGYDLAPSAVNAGLQQQHNYVVVANNDDFSNNYNSEQQTTISSYRDHVTKWLSEQTCDGTVRRRRKVTRRQRAAANDRERRRMRQLNTAFDRLRELIPTGNNISYSAQSDDPDSDSQRPLSRIQTLRLAIDYIAFMTNTLQCCSNWPPVSSSNHYNTVITQQFTQDETFNDNSATVFNTATDSTQQFIDQLTLTPLLTSDTVIYQQTETSAQQLLSPPTTPDDINISYVSL